MLAVNNAITGLIMSLVQNPKVQQILPTFRNDELIDSIYQHLVNITGQAYIKVIDIKDKSAGLVVEDRKIKLSQDWGVKLANTTHSSYIDIPASVRFISDTVMVANNNPMGAALVSIFDKNLNYVGPVGLRGLTYTAGQLTIASDCTYDASNGRYYIVSTPDNIVQVYNKATMSYAYSLGDGTLGANSTSMSAPVAVSVGVNGIYVLCQAGTPTGSTGLGYLATYTSAGVFKSIPLYKGKNGGTGRCIQGEISSPKDMVVVTTGGRDFVYILNSTDEIGVFSADDWKMVDVINIPSNLSNASLGLSRMSIKDNTVYVTCANTGQVVAIDLKTKQLSGVFGTLRSEATADNDGTLGYFNGLCGIAALDDKLIVAESLNNRIQVFGKALLTESSFSITFEPVNIRAKKLIDIAPSLAGDAASDIVLVDPSDNTEYDIKTAIARNLDFFSVKMKIQPSMFSRKKQSFAIYPVYVLVEQY